MELIFIYGPPGVGKLTVARELSGILGYSVFHNHIAIDLAKSIYGNSGPRTQEMIRAVNLAAIATTASIEKGLIFTYARPNDLDFIGRTMDIVERSGGSVFFVELRCDARTLLRRMESRKGSAFSKITEKKALFEFKKVYGPFKKIRSQHSISINTSKMSALAAARAIKKKLSMQRG